MTALQDCQAIEVSDLVIRERSSIRRAVPAGMLVNEYRPRDPKGSEEIGAVYRLVFAEESPASVKSDGD